MSIQGKGKGEFQWVDAMTGKPIEGLPVPESVSLEDAGTVAFQAGGASEALSLQAEGAEWSMTTRYNALDSQGSPVRWMTPTDALEGAEVNVSQQDIQVMAEMMIQGGWTAPLKRIVNAEGEALGFAYGLGRAKALAWMERQHSSNPQLFPVPEGIQVNDQGQWEFPYERFKL